MADAGTFEYWMAGEQPPAEPDGIDDGTMEYWMAGERPPVLGQGEDDVAYAPMRCWGWGWVGA